MKVKINEIQEGMSFSVSEDNNIGVEVEETMVTGGTTDYNKLKNKPRLNGKTIEGNINEIDPTVPQWAKAPSKPEYTPTELGCVSEDAELTLEEINDLCDMVFNN